MNLLHASSAYIWTQCPGSTRLERYESPPHPVALEGRLIHLLTELIGTGKVSMDTSCDGIRQNPEVMLRNKTGLVVTRDFVDTAKEAAAFCIAKGPGYWETAFPEDCLPPEVGGTADFFTFDEKTQTLHVVDLKFGYAPVEPYENPQLLLYSMGALRMLRVLPERVALHVVQPRDYVNGPYKTWEISHLQWDRYSNQLMGQAERAVQGSSTVTGPHCKYCNSRMYCEGFLKAVHTAVETVVFSPETRKLTAVHLGAEYALLKRAEALVTSARKAFEEKIVDELENGRPVSGWVLSTRSGRRYWSAPVEDIKAVAQITGLKLIEEKPISITEALRNKEILPLIENLISISDGTKILAPFDGRNIPFKELTDD